MTTGTSMQPAKTFEWWMLTMFAMGAAYSAFVSLLIPPFVTEVTGNASSAGVVMAIIALGAILGPPLGTFADNHSAHRLVLVAGVFGMALSFAMYALSAKDAALYALDAILMGVSIAAVSAAGPVFIVGANLPQEIEAKQMTTFQLMMPAGQLVGGLLLAAAASWSFDARFWLGAGFIGLLGVVALFTTSAPNARLQAAIAQRQEVVGEVRKTTLRQIFISTFGLFWLVLVLTSITSNGINSQIANILPNVYGIEERTTSALISAAGLLNIVLFFPAGRWMGRSGPFPVFTAGVVARTVAALGMAVAGVAFDNAVILGAAMMQLLYQGNPFVRLGQNTNAARFATFPQGAVQGWVIASSAVGSFIGAALGGVLADSIGFNSINWMAAISGGLAVLLIVLWLAPANKKLEAESEADA
jgi:predicted MFS family arabinose efflux permease